MAIVPKAENFRVLPQGVNASFNSQMKPVDVMSGGAREMMRGLDALGDFFEKQEDEDVIERSNRYLMDLSNLQDGYIQRQGEQALKDDDGSDAMENVFASGRQAREAAVEGLSWRARRKFERAVGAGERSFSHGVNQHHFRQEGVFADNQMTVRQTQQGQLISRNFAGGNRDVANASLDQLRDETYWYLRNRKGMSDEQARISAAVNQSGLLTSIIEGMSRNGDQEGAVALMQERIGDLNPAHYVRLQEMLTANQAISDGQSAAEMVIANNGKPVTVSTGGRLSDGVVVPRDAATDVSSFARNIAVFAAPHESGSKGWAATNGRSTAKGKYQILSGVWKKELKDRYGKVFTDADFHDPVKGEEIFQLVARANYEDAVRLTGRRRFTPGECYQIWFLGAGGFADMARARPDQPVTSVRGISGVISSNIDSKGNGYLTRNFKPRTVGEFRQFMEMKMGGKSVKGGVDAKQYRLPAADWLHMSPDEIRLTLEKAVPDNKAFRDTLYEGIARRAHIAQRQESEALQAREDAAFAAVSGGMSFSQIKQKGMLDGLKPGRVAYIRKLADAEAPPDYGRVNKILSDYGELANTPDAEVAALTKDNPALRKMLMGFKQDMFSGRNFRYFAARKAVKEFLKVNMDIDPNSKKSSEQEKLSNLYVYMDRQIEDFRQQNKRYPNEDEILTVLGVANERVNRDSAWAVFMPSVPRYHPSANNLDAGN